MQPPRGTSALRLSRFKLLLIAFSLSGAAIILQISNRANNSSVPELAGRWTVASMEVDPSYGYYIWENLNFTIDSRGLIGNRRTPFTMTVFRGNCSPNCYYVHDSRSSSTTPLYRLVRQSPERIYLFPEYPATDKKIVFARLRE